MNIITILIATLLGGSAPQYNVPIVEHDYVMDLFKKKNDTTYVINFWATWCAPCVAEIPDFERFNSEHKADKVKVILVSIDFLSRYDTKLIPFIQENNIMSDVVLMKQPRGTDWIDDIHKDWTGAIPATYIYSAKKKFRKFYNGELSYKELQSIYEQIEER